MKMRTTRRMSASALGALGLMLMLLGCATDGAIPTDPSEALTNTS